MICGTRAVCGRGVASGDSGRLAEAMRLFGKEELQELLRRRWRGICMIWVGA